MSQKQFYIGYPNFLIKSILPADLNEVEPISVCLLSLQILNHRKMNLSLCLVTIVFICFESSMIKNYYL